MDRAGPFNRMQPSTNSEASKSPLPGASLAEGWRLTPTEMKPPCFWYVKTVRSPYVQSHAVTCWFLRMWGEVRLFRVTFIARQLPIGDRCDSLSGRIKKQLQNLSAHHWHWQSIWVFHVRFPGLSVALGHFFLGNLLWYPKIHWVCSKMFQSFREKSHGPHGLFTSPNN